MRHSHQPGIDSESLQADVMRFMAIIAFCLIAILALVRNVEAPPTTLPAAAPTPAQVQAPRPTTAEAVPVPASVPKIEPRVTAATLEAAPEPTPEPEPKPEPKPIARIPDTTAKPFLIAPSKPLEPALPITLMEPIKPQQVPEIAAAPPPEAPPEALPTPNKPPAEAAPERPVSSDAAAVDAVAEAEPGLSLRFTSDRDFLRLVSKGDVRVFLFDQQRSFELSRSYRFDAASPPGQLYEVMPETIPAAIGRAAQGNLQRYPDLRWGLVMPVPIQRQIADYVAAVDTGELRIDRFGEVHHVQNR